MGLFSGLTSAVGDLIGGAAGFAGDLIGGITGSDVLGGATGALDSATYKAVQDANREQADEQFNANLDWLKYQYADQKAKDEWVYWDQKQKDEWVYWDQNRRQDEYAKNAAGWQMRDLMETADEMGIHRLAALGGAGAGYTPVQSTGQTSNAGSVGAAAPTNVENQGGPSALSSAIKGIQQSRQMKAEQETHKARLANIEADTALLEAQATTQEAQAVRLLRGNADVYDQNLEDIEKSTKQVKTLAGETITVPVDPMDIGEYLGAIITETRGLIKKGNTEFTGFLNKLLKMQEEQAKRDKAKAKTKAEQNEEKYSRRN